MLVYKVMKKTAGWKHQKQRKPDIVASVESIYCTTNAATIKQRQRLAERIFTCFPQQKLSSRIKFILKAECSILQIGIETVTLLPMLFGIFLKMFKPFTN